MKRINLFLILLALASCAWAQTKVRYTESLDSIVVYEYWMPSFENLTTYKNYLNTSSMGSKPNPMMKRTHLCNSPTSQKEAIITGNRSHAESLIGSEFQRVVSNLDPVINIQ